MSSTNIKQEGINLGGKVLKIYEGVICKENFTTVPFKKFIKVLFNSGQKYKEEGNDILQKLKKILMTSLFGENIRKDITEESKCKSENWMSTKYDDRVLYN